MIYLDSGWCILPIILLLFAAVFVSTRKTSERERYEKPQVVAARVINECRGELEVTSSHSEHVLRELSLPYHSVVSILDRNSRYLVSFPIPQKRTPPYWKAKVWNGGSKKEVMVFYSQAQHARDFVSAAAVQNGYKGAVTVPYEMTGE